jgi:hypothetical protein
MPKKVAPYLGQHITVVSPEGIGASELKVERAEIYPDGHILGEE